MAVNGISPINVFPQTFSTNREQVAVRNPAGFFRQTVFSQEQPGSAANRISNLAQNANQVVELPTAPNAAATEANPILTDVSAPASLAPTVPSAQSFVDALLNVVIVAGEPEGRLFIDALAAPPVEENATSAAALAGRTVGQTRPEEQFALQQLATPQLPAQPAGQPAVPPVTVGAAFIPQNLNLATTVQTPLPVNQPLQAAAGGPVQSITGISPTVTVPARQAGVAALTQENAPRQTTLAPTQALQNVTLVAPPPLPVAVEPTLPIPGAPPAPAIIQIGSAQQTQLQTPAQIIPQVLGPSPPPVVLPVNQALAVTGQGSQLQAAALPGVVNVSAGNVENAAAGSTIQLALDEVQGQDILVQNALLVSEALRNLNVFTSDQTTSLLIDETPVNLAASDIFQELTPIQQNELFINLTLQNLNFIADEETSALLINETPAVLEAAGIFEALTLLQQNALLVNETLLDLGVLPLGPLTLAGDGGGLVPQAAEDRGLPAPAAQEATGPAAAVQAVPAVAAESGTGVLQTTSEADVALSALEETSGTVSGLQAAPQAAATVIAEETVETEIQSGLDLNTLPYLLNPDRTFFPHVAYDLLDPLAFPVEPEPVAKDIPPVLPSEKSRHIDELVQSYSQESEDRGGGRRRRFPPAAPVVQSINFMIKQTNNNLSAAGSPLHLVLARNEQGYRLDVFDCSYNDQCALSYDVPLELTKLPVILNSLDHESGLIVDSAI